MSPVADDFAAIASRLKEIQAEVAKQQAAAEAEHNAHDQPQDDSANVLGDMTACA